MTTPPATLPPYGAHRPGLLFRATLAASRRVPRIPVIKQLSFLFRRIARAADGGHVDVRHWGLRLRLSPAGNISEGGFLFMPDRWDRAERQFLAERLHSGAVVVDVGSNAGGYLWWVQHVLGSEWRGVAVEPDPELRARLALNLAENDMAHVQLFGCGVAPEHGQARLRIHRENRGQNRLLVDGSAADGGEHDESAARSVVVRMIPLPELLKEADVERVDALKIDVEGMEPAILDDFLDRAPASLFPGAILMEATRSSPPHQALIERLEGLGYRARLRTQLNIALVRA